MATEDQHPIEEIETATDTGADASAEVVDTAADTPDAPATESVDEAAASAFDKAIEDAAKSPGDAPKDAADVAAKASDAAAPAAASEDPAKAAQEQDVDQDVKDLGLKGKSEARFREMAGTIKEAAPLREILTDYKISDPGQLKEVLETASRGIEWENTVLSSTATPEQFGVALNTIKALNGTDNKAKSMAFDQMLDAVQRLGKDLGRDVPGLLDALDDHPDLKAEVEDSSITRKRALEIVAQRANSTATETRDHAQAQRDAYQSALSEAINVDVPALNEELKRADPDFIRKLPYLQPTLDNIRETLHPSKWANAIRAAHARLPQLPAVAAPAPSPAANPRVGHMPARATGSGATMQRKPQTAEEAFDMALEAASNR